MKKTFVFLAMILVAAVGVVELGHTTSFKRLTMEQKLHQAKTAEDLRKVFDETTNEKSEDGFRREVIIKMMEIATTNEDLWWAYGAIREPGEAKPENKLLQEKILEKIESRSELAVERAATSRELLSIFPGVPEGGVAEQRAFVKFMLNPSVQDLWEFVWQQGRSDMQVKTLYTILGRTGSIQEARKVYLESLKYEHERGEGYKKISDQSLRDMLDRAVTVDDFLLVYKTAPDHTKVRYQSLSRIPRVVRNFDDAWKAYQGVPSGTQVEKEILKKLLAFASTREQKEIAQGLR